MNPPPASRPLLVGLGELLWDLLPAGPQLGGAPANFAYHAHALGAEALIISCVGDDPPGREALARLGGLGLRIDGIATHPTAPTGTVEVALDAAGKPNYTIHQEAAWDFIGAAPALVDACARAAAVCFGTLGRRHAVAGAAIRTLVAATPPTALRIFDINLRQAFWSPRLIEDSLESANVLKLNDEELPVLGRALGLTGDEPARLRQLATRFGLRAVALTKGARGAALLLDHDYAEHPGEPVAVADTVGAGDSFTAALALGMLENRPAAEILGRAIRVAGWVCSQPGAMPAMPSPEILFHSQPRSSCP